MVCAFARRALERARCALSLAILASPCCLACFFIFIIFAVRPIVVRSHARRAVESDRSAIADHDLVVDGLNSRHTCHSVLDGT
jgi:hypothetical protein